MSARSPRLIALTGAAWSLLAVAGIVAGGGETPEGDAKPAKIVSYYSSHSSEIKVSAILFSLGFLFFLLFGGTLRAFLRRNASNEPLATLMLVALGVVAVAAGIGGGIEVGLASNIHHLGPEAAQAANLVENETFLPVVVGGFVFAFCNGVAILRGVGLPRWLGWVAIVLAVLFLIPPTGFVSFALLILWTLVLSIVMYLRYDAQAPGEAAPAATGA